MSDSQKKTKMTLEKLARMTANEFAAIRRDFATKEDLKRFATKEDLKRFATKEDLKRFATKEDLKRFATKEDLEALEIKITRTVIQSNDKLATKLDVYFKDNAAHSMLHMRVDDKLLDHEKRIKSLERV